MERTKLDEIMVVCENPECKEPLFISLALEACLRYFSVLICQKCGHRHTDIEQLKEFSKNTRNYGQL